MSLLFRVLFKEYGKLILLFLIGICVLFVLMELPTRAQSLAGTQGLPLFLIKYFGARSPAVMAVYLPVCCLISGVILLGSSQSNRETIALNSGGVSYSRIVLLVFICGLFWSGMQFALEQYAGLPGNSYASALISEQRGQAGATAQVREVWFAEGEYLVKLDLINSDGSGQGFWAIRYGAAESGARGPSEIVSARSFQGRAGEWRLFQAGITRPETFSAETAAELVLPLKQSPQLFFVIQDSNPQELPFRVLQDAIERLEGAGTDTAPYRTAWHECFAYAMLGAAFTLAAAAIVSMIPNLYLSLLVGITVALGGIFLNSSLLELGSSGAITPVLAAWGTPLLLSLLAAVRLTWSHFHR